MKKSNLIIKILIIVSILFSCSTNELDDEIISTERETYIIEENTTLVDVYVNYLDCINLDTNVSFVLFFNNYLYLNIENYNCLTVTFVGFEEKEDNPGYYYAKYRGAINSDINLSSRIEASILKSNNCSCDGDLNIDRFYATELPVSVKDSNLIVYTNYINPFRFDKIAYCE